MYRIVENHRRLAIALGVLVVPITAYAAMSAATQPTGLLTCDIRASQSGGQVTLNPSVTTQNTANGSYAFKVNSVGASNGTNINQSGNFAAQPHQPVTLGSVMLDATGTVYQATLDIKTNSQKISCSKRIGSSI